MQLNLAPMNARRPIGVKTMRLFFGLAALAAVLVTTPLSSATAAGPQGSAKFKFSYGAAGKSLNNQGAKISPLAQTKSKYMKGPRLNVTSKVDTVSVRSVSNVEMAKVRLRGGVRISKGKRSVRIGGLVLKANPGDVKINAKVKGKIRTAFVAKGSNAIDADLGTLKVGWTKLKLSPGVARLIKQRLNLKRLPAGQIGSFSATAQEAFEDPYLDLCGLPATSLSLATFPEAVGPPVLGDPVTTVGEPITWGIKEGLNGYVNVFGSIQGLDGATVNRIFMAPPQVPPTGFTFVPQQGEYDSNGAGTADDQAVLNGSGSVMYCNQAHGFRINISNPTVVIDGGSSRLIADVNTNISGDLMPTKRVHLADLDLSEAIITEPQAGEVQWEFPADQLADTPTSAVTLSQDGSEALRLCEVSLPGAPPGCLYPPGTLLDELTVNAVFAQG